MLWSVNLVSADDSLFDNEHYVIVGHIYVPYSEDNQVVLTNIQTGEQLTVISIDCEHGLKEYMFNLANLHQGWTHNDTFIINYGSEFIDFKIIKDSRNYQQDIQRPDNVDPIFIFIGFFIIAVGSGYFYMKKKKQITQGEENMTEEDTQEQETSTEKQNIIDRIFGGTKKAWVLIATVGLFVAWGLDIDVPTEFFVLYSTVVGIYFGVGGVKLGLETQNKE